MLLLHTLTYIMYYVSYSSKQILKLVFVTAHNISDGCYPWDVPFTDQPVGYGGGMNVLVALNITCQCERLVTGWKVRSFKSGSFKVGFFRPVSSPSTGYQLLGSNTLQIQGAGLWVSAMMNQHGSLYQAIQIYYTYTYFVIYFSRYKTL